MDHKVILPWEADPDLPETVWAKGALTTREFGNDIYTPLSGLKLKQVTAIAEALVCHNLWSVCLTASAYHMRTLYPYIAATWMYSRRDTADIMDADMLLQGAFSFDTKEKEAFKDKILGTGLLIIPRIDPTHMGMAKVRGVLSSMLMNRKMRNLPVLTDIQTQHKPRDGESLKGELKQLQDVLGESTPQLFNDGKSKIFLVKTC